MTYAVDVVVMFWEFIIDSHNWTLLFVSSSTSVNWHRYLKIDTPLCTVHIIVLYMCLPGCGSSLTGSRGQFNSPNWPNAYPQNRICDWLITTPSGTMVQLNVSQTDLPGSSIQCDTDYVDVGVIPIHSGICWDVWVFCKRFVWWGKNYTLLRDWNFMLFVYSW